MQVSQPLDASPTGKPSPQRIESSWVDTVAVNVHQERMMLEYRTALLHLRLYLCPLNPSTNDETWSTEGCEPLNLPMDAAPLAACTQDRVNW